MSPSVTSLKLKRLKDEGIKRSDIVYRAKKKCVLINERKGIGCNLDHAKLFRPDLEELGKKNFTDKHVL